MRERTSVASGAVAWAANWCVAWFMMCPAWAAHAGDSNSLMDVSSDGSLIACSNRDSGTVTIVRAADLKKLHELKVGLHPEGVSFLGATHHVAVAVYGEDRLTLLDADEGRELGRVELFDEPYGVVSRADGSRLYVTLDYPGRVAEIDPVAKQVVREWDAGPFARGLALSKDGTRLYASLYYSGDVVALQIADGVIVDRWPGSSNDNLTRQITIHPTRPKLYLPHIRSRVTAVHGEGSIFPYVSVLDTRPSDEKRRRRIPMDAFQGNLVTSNPWEGALSPDGKRYYVLFGGTDDLFSCQVVDDDYRELAPLRYARLGKNPRAVRVAPAGDRVYVYSALDFTLTALDAGSLQRLGAVEVTSNPLSPEILEGKILFY